MKSHTIIIKEPVFYCYQDETHFFSWLESLEALQTLTRTGQGLAATFAVPIDDASLMDLIGLLTRYGLDRRPLSAFATDENLGWFCRSRSFWYRSVFRAPSK